MSSKINSAASENTNIANFDQIKEELRIAELEDMSDAEYKLAKFKETGERPVKVAKVDADKFGLRHAYFDIYAPVENQKAGVWMLQKDAETGEEVIVKKS
jgi:nitrogen fixation protein FixH